MNFPVIMPQNYIVEPSRNSRIMWCKPPFLSCLPSPSSITTWVLWKKQIPQVWISLVGLFARVVSPHEYHESPTTHLISVHLSPVGWWVRGLYDPLYPFIYPIGSMYGIYANIWGILMVNVTIYGICGSYGYWGFFHNAKIGKSWEIPF